MAEAPLSTLAIYSARPTVRVDGQEQPRLSGLIVAMDMLEAEGGMSTLELRLSNLAAVDRGRSEPAFEDERILRLGSILTVYAGDEAEPAEIFRGVVTCLEVELAQGPPPELVVIAEDALQRARMARRTHVHSNTSIAEVATRVARTASLRPVITGFGKTIGTWMQLDESDLAFLRRLLARHDGDVQVVGDELHVGPRGDRVRGQLELHLGRQLQKARVRADLAHQVTEVTVSGWDAAAGRRVKATSTGRALGPGAGRLGSELVRDALGERSEHVRGCQVATAAEAQALADAAFDRRARRFVVVEGTAEGNPSLRVGTHLALRGIGPRFDNTYHVVHARHRYDVVRGYETDFEAECARLGEAR